MIKKTISEPSPPKKPQHITRKMSSFGLLFWTTKNKCRRATDFVINFVTKTKQNMLKTIEFCHEICSGQKNDMFFLFLTNYTHTLISVFKYTPLHIFVLQSSICTRVSIKLWRRDLDIHFWIFSPHFCAFSILVNQQTCL